MNRGDVQRPSEQAIEFCRVMHNGSPSSAQRKRGTNAQRKTKLLRRLLAFEKAFGGSLRRHGHPDFVHE